MQPNDPVQEILSFVNNGGNAEQELRNQLSRNPTKAQEFGKFVQQNRGRNPWDILNELASQRGINLNNYPLPRR